MDIIGQLRKQSYDQGAAVESRPIGGTYRPQTISELLDAQIEYHENKIKDLKEARLAVTPELEKALNALAKL